MSDNQRNSAAGQRQKQYAQKAKTEQQNTLNSHGLTRKNEDFIYQLNKQLIAHGMHDDTKREVLDDTIQQLKEGQKKGQTAKQLFGTPTAYVYKLGHPDRNKIAAANNSPYYLLALDNGLMFFAIFAFMFGLLAVMNPGSVSPKYHYGSSGLTALIIVAVTGGLLFGYISTLMQPYKDPETGEYKNRSWIFRIIMITLTFLAWIGIYMFVSLLPNSINPQPSKWAYLVMAVVVFAIDLWLRAHFHIVNNVFGDSRRARQREQRERQRQQSRK